MLCFRVGILGSLVINEMFIEKSMNIPNKTIQQTIYEY